MTNRFVRVFGQQASRFRYLVLMCSLLMLVTVYPILSAWSQSHYLFDVLFCIALLANVPAVGRRRAVVWIATALAVTAVTAFLVPETTEIPLPKTPGLGLGAVLLLYTAAAILVDIFKNRRVTSDTICGAICVYLLLGVTWALLLKIVAIHHAGSTAAFNGLYAESDFHHFVYFSFVTLTTLGYGDIVPVSPPARMLCWLEALFGQLFIAVLIARFVGLHGRSMRPDSRPSEE